MYVAQCTQCCTRRNFPAPVIEETIISKRFLRRVQVDIVSIKKYPDREYRYIAHLRDHFTRYSWTCQLRTKETAEVAAFLFSVFTVFGPPYILQSDNGREFTAQIIYELLSLPTNHTPYALVFGQHPLRHFNMIEEWKKHSINMEEDLPEGIIESEKYENFHTTSPSSRPSTPFLILYEKRMDNQRDIQTVNSQTCVHTNDCITLQQTTSEDAEMVKEQTISTHNIVNNQKTTAKGKENQIIDNSYTPYKKRRVQIIQEASNNPTFQHNIYRNVANKNLENYRSKMKHQMHAKYKIHEHTCEVSGVVLPLGPKEFPELDNPSINITISIIEAARLQSNALASATVRETALQQYVLAEKQIPYMDADVIRKIQS
ncbi:22317_t:CDS:2 [Gigaspora margarita]|uniref:22317_t:CDS:1 n=1 Tax=Gigaspora margarita TaxID=4874 RepID=A0ABM8W2V4_GIGMA|nr:22317_t:CDS:2 [Gigaspora margarita]